MPIAMQMPGIRRNKTGNKRGVRRVSKADRDIDERALLGD
jgi:hypothetical protein